MDVLVVQERLRQRYPGLDLWVTLTRSGYLEVKRLVLPVADQGRGTGTAVMRALVTYADTRQLPLALTPDPAFGGRVVRLRQFFRRFGFVPNRHDYATCESWVRSPQKGGGAAEGGCDALHLD